MRDLFSVATPGFAHLIDYVGLWAVDPIAANRILEAFALIDIEAHVARGAAPLVSAVEKIQPASLGGKSVAVVRLTGLLMKSQSSLGGTSTIQARRDIRSAAADPEVGGILLAIDSPGGTVAGTHDLGEEIRAAGKVKPVWAHVEDQAASAAYWAASQAHKITANAPTALVGSIGTMQRLEDSSAQAEREGRRQLVFATGPLKGVGAPGAKVTEEHAAHIQSLVDNAQRSFDEAVKRGRGLSASQLEAVRHGGQFPARAALDAKLIDAIQPLSKTLSDFSHAVKGGMRHEDDLQQEPVSTGRLPVVRQHLPMLSTSGK